VIGEALGWVDVRVAGQVLDVSIATGEEARTDVWGARWLIDAGPEGPVWVTGTGTARAIGRMGVVREGAFVEVWGTPVPMDTGGFFVSAISWRLTPPAKLTRWDRLAVAMGSAIGRFTALVEMAKQRRMQPRDPAWRVGRREERVR
jgi:hypothetical protein